MTGNREVFFDAAVYDSPDQPILPELLLAVAAALTDGTTIREHRKLSRRRDAQAAALRLGTAHPRNLTARTRRASLRLRVRGRRSPEIYAALAVRCAELDTAQELTRIAAQSPAAPLGRAREALDRFRADLHAIGKPSEAPAPRASHRIVIYIDHLDRCPAQHVTTMLTAIENLLAAEPFAVILAASPGPLIAAVRRSREVSASDALEQLDRAFEISYTLPPMTAMPDNTFGSAPDEVSAQEREFMDVLAKRLLPNVRVRRRLATLYQLIRAGMSRAERSRLLEQRTFQVIQILLTLLLGEPEMGPYLLAAINASPDDDLLEFLLSPACTAISGGGWPGGAALPTRMAGLLSAVQTSMREPLNTDMAEYRAWSPVVVPFGLHHTPAAAK